MTRCLLPKMPSIVPIGTASASGKLGLEELVESTGNIVARVKWKNKPFGFQINP